ncbi:RNA chaperone Hfq [Paenibacillus sp. J2TS4]|uniref:RNA chaperone Hfq n=1 Tax=Paenibacillus sp. J2TS4 TaxID=2807194 RepID=UPI001B20CD84|nr:RNA chaperone Hfq [Paenibacillus sp. J2TS4]GIP32215.1 hypothetical protein J2TS4_14250 [Paenibacillus sp. J2TS4]
MLDQQQSTQPTFDQNMFLNTLRKKRTKCTVITVNGVQIKGTIGAFDKYVIVLQDSFGKQHTLYKSALSTIIPEFPVDLHPSSASQ